MKLYIYSTPAGWYTLNSFGNIIEGPNTGSDWSKQDARGLTYALSGIEPPITLTEVAIKLGRSELSICYKAIRSGCQVNNFKTTDSSLGFTSLYTKVMELAGEPDISLVGIIDTCKQGKYVPMGERVPLYTISAPNHYTSASNHYIQSQGSYVLTPNESLKEPISPPRPVSPFKRIIELYEQLKVAYAAAKLMDKSAFSILPSIEPIDPNIVFARRAYSISLREPPYYFMEDANCYNVYERSDPLTKVVSLSKNIPDSKKYIQDMLDRLNIRS